MKFVDFVGNEKIKQQLLYLLEASQLPHAIILEGEEGLGKKTLAREIALNLFCKAEDSPCRQCHQCSKVQKGVHPDVYEYTADGGAGSFHIDTVRDIINDAAMPPNEADYRVFILGNCQCMNKNAQNALLKIFEEPPKYAVFILTVTNKSALLETILSRGVVYKLNGVDENVAADYICSKNEDIDYADTLRAVQVWGGNIGKALESLKDGKLSKINGYALDVANALLSENEYDLICACSVFERNKDVLISTLALLKALFRDALVYGSSDMLSGNAETAVLLSSRLSKESLYKLVNVSENIRVLAERNSNNAIMITKLCYDLRRALGR